MDKKLWLDAKAAQAVVDAGTIDVYTEYTGTLTHEIRERIIGSATVR